MPKGMGGIEKRFAAKGFFCYYTKLEIANPKGSLPMAGGRGAWGEFRPPCGYFEKSVRIFSNALRHKNQARSEESVFCG